MKTLLTTLCLTISFAFLDTIYNAAEARCVCRCVNGNMQPLCSSTLDIPPICPPTVCQIRTPSLAPLPSLKLPPLGTTSCRQAQVLNPYTGRYEWKRVCRWDENILLVFQNEKPTHHIHTRIHPDVLIHQFCWVEEGGWKCEWKYLLCGFWENQKTRWVCLLLAFEWLLETNRI